MTTIKLGDKTIEIADGLDVRMDGEKIVVSPKATPLYQDWYFQPQPYISPITVPMTGTITYGSSGNSN